MATDREFITTIMDRLSGLEDLTCKSMMGEYMIYLRGKIVAYVCDDRLLVKPTASAVSMLPSARYEVPYDGAKELLRVADTDNGEFLKELFSAVYDELPAPKPKKKSPKQSNDG